MHSNIVFVFVTVCALTVISTDAYNSTSPVNTTKSPTASTTTVRTTAPGVTTSRKVTTPASSGSSIGGPGNNGGPVHLPSFITMMLAVCASLYGFAGKV